MLDWHDLAFFALAALVLVLTPGPNMIYCVSRALCQGRAAGLVSLAGAARVVVHSMAAALGLTASLMAAAVRSMPSGWPARLPALAGLAGGAPGGAAPFQAPRAAGRSTAQAVQHGALSPIC